MADKSGPAGRGSRNRSLKGLDWLNFSIANIQTGFGPFIAIYLAGQRWTQVEIGLALSVGTVAAMVSQVPAGLLVDAVADKRLIAGAGILAVTVSALIFAVDPTRLAVMVAEILHGFASCVISPAIAAIALSLVGISAMGQRIGRNARFASIGNGLAAGVMGLCGTYVSEQAVFFLTALLTVPAMVSLSAIRRRDLVSTGPYTGHAMITRPDHRVGLRRVFSRGLVVFSLAAFLFQLSNAAQLPLAAVAISRLAGANGGIVIGACIVLPQLVVAALSPTVGRLADRWGTRPVLLLGFLALPVRALALGSLSNPYLIVAVQALDGISAAVFGVMLPLICADVTRGTGRFNLAQGIVGLVGGGGATISTILAGWLADHAGRFVAFLGLAGAGGLAILLIFLAMPETSRKTRDRARQH
jgi:MFS family permease